MGPRGGLERGRRRAALADRRRRARGEVWSEGDDGRPWQIGAAEGGVVTRIESSRGSVRAELRVGEGQWGEAVCPSGEPGGWVWTRKRVAPVRCRIELPGRVIETEAWGIEDESAGYHPRHTVWRWSAGVGVAAGGRRVGWNLVSGVNDPPERSERTLWVGGEVSEPGAVTFDDDLGGLSFADGARLSFHPEAERRARENLGLVRFDYRQPFGTFSGSLEGGLELERGWGVMEHHDAVW